MNKRIIMTLLPPAVAVLFASAYISMMLRMSPGKDSWFSAVFCTWGFLASWLVVIAPLALSCSVMMWPQQDKAGHRRTVLMAACTVVGTLALPMIIVKVFWR